MRLLKVGVTVLGMFVVLPSIASPLSISSGSNPFIPTDVLDQVSQSDLKQKSKFCVGNSERIFSQLQKLSEQPPLKLEGYNSRMDNRDEVIGAEQLDQFVLRMSEAYTDSWFTEDDSKKERLLDYLARWAESGALLETYNCMAKGYYDGRGECAEWRQKDGQDISKAKDYSTAQINLMHLAYGYYLLLSDFNPSDPKHQVIQDWFKQLFGRNKSADDVSFGLDLGWHWPNIVYGRLTGAGNFSKNNPDKLLKRAVRKLDSIINSDGSFVNRTTRGNRALWYHLTGLNETLVTLEMARAAGIEISADLDERVQKAGEIFIRGFEDHSYMDQWAKEAHNSIYVPGEQIFNSRFDTPNGNAAMFILMYRYPESEAAKKIAGYLGQTPNAGRMDAYIGFGMGCFYAVAKESRDGSWISGGEILSKRDDVAQPLVIKKSYPRGSYLERNYKEIKFAVEDAAVEGTKIRVPSLNFGLMFDFDSSDEMKPILVRIKVDKDQLPEILEAESIEKCNKSTFKKDSNGVTVIRLALGEQEKYKNECLLSALSEANRLLLLGLEKSLPAIIASGINTEFGQQAHLFLGAYMSEWPQSIEMLASASPKNLAQPLLIKGSYPTGSHSENNYKDVKFTAVNVTVEGTQIVLPLLRFNLMFDFEGGDQTKPILVRIELDKDQLPDTPPSDSLDSCNKTTFKKDAMGLQKVRLALGEHADYKNECLLSSLSEANRSLVLGLEKSLPSIIASSTNTEFGQQAATLMDAYSTK